jgi:hypothetical protein
MPVVLLSLVLRFIWAMEFALPQMRGNCKKADDSYQPQMEVASYEEKYGLSTKLSA